MKSRLFIEDMLDVEYYEVIAMPTVLATKLLLDSSHSLLYWFVYRGDCSVVEVGSKF